MATRVKVLYFADFREAAGVQNETVTTDATTAGQFYDEMCARHRWTRESSAVRVAINEELCEWDAVLAEGDTVVFLGPFAGG